MGVGAGAGAGAGTGAGAGAGTGADAGAGAGSGAGAGAGVGAGAGAKEEEKKAISTQAVCIPPGSPSEARLVPRRVYLTQWYPYGVPFESLSLLNPPR